MLTQNLYSHWRQQSGHSLVKAALSARQVWQTVTRTRGGQTFRPAEEQVLEVLGVLQIKHQTGTCKWMQESICTLMYTLNYHVTIIIQHFYHTLGNNDNSTFILCYVTITIQPFYYAQSQPQLVAPSTLTIDDKEMTLTTLANNNMLTRNIFSHWITG